MFSTWRLEQAPQLGRVSLVSLAGRNWVGLRVARACFNLLSELILTDK